MLRRVTSAVCGPLSRSPLLSMTGLATSPAAGGSALTAMPLSPSLLLTQHMNVMGGGGPQQRGKRKPNVWMRRKPWFSRQLSLDLKRVKKGPETPHFPDGTPYTLIRKFRSFAGRGYKVNLGRRKKVRHSLKRGR